MANLQAIYQEFGLSGLIPYALKPESKGRQLLIEKIKEGAVRTRSESSRRWTRSGFGSAGCGQGWGARRSWEGPAKQRLLPLRN